MTNLEKDCEILLAKYRTKELIDIIFKYGDQDVCAVNHIGHGTSMLMQGYDPSVQDNYVDYDTAGPSFPLSDSSANRYIESGFNTYIWKDIKDMYDKFGIKIFDLVNAEQGHMICEFWWEYPHVKQTCI